MFKKKNQNNPFRNGNGGHVEKSKKAAEWGKVKFNPVPKTIATENATPWSQFKSEIIQKQKDEAQESRNNVDNPRAKALLQKREENYRKNLIGIKRNEPTKWEDFSDETQAEGKNGKGGRPTSSLDALDLVPGNEFDSKKLSAKQNNQLKRFITRQTYKKRNITLEMAVNDLRRNGVKKNKNTFK